MDPENVYVEPDARAFGDHAFDFSVESLVPGKELIETRRTPASVRWFGYSQMRRRIDRKRMPQDTNTEPKRGDRVSPNFGLRSVARYGRSTRGMLISIPIARKARLDRSSAVGGSPSTCAVCAFSPRSARWSTRVGNPPCPERIRRPRSSEDFRRRRCCSCTSPAYALPSVFTKGRPSGNELSLSISIVVDHGPDPIRCFRLLYLHCHSVGARCRFHGT